MLRSATAYHPHSPRTHPIPAPNNHPFNQDQSPPLNLWLPRPPHHLNLRSIVRAIRTQSNSLRPTLPSQGALPDPEGPPRPRPLTSGSSSFAAGRPAPYTAPEQIHETEDTEHTPWQNCTAAN